MTNELIVESVNLLTIAQTYGTPCYVYSSQKIIDNYQQYQAGFGDKPHLICYSVKANSNLSILKILAKCGAGFDIVSGGELARVLAIGAKSEKIVFSGVGKTSAEITAALQADIACFNVESIEELSRIEHIAQQLNLPARVSIRVNPNIDAKTHPYISTGLKENKFGIAIETAISIYQTISSSKYLIASGIDFHIGSQLTELAPFTAAITKVLAVVTELDKLNIKLQYIDIGGGLGINYQNNSAPKPNQLTAIIAELTQSQHEKIIIEPGRSIVGDAGVFLTKVEYLKTNQNKNFCIVDGGMNDLIRPALYNAWQEIIPLQMHAELSPSVYDVVGPICETGDFFAKNRNLAIKTGDFLAIKNSGAYGFSMASNYNSRPRACEVLITKDSHKLIRARETTAELFANEMALLF